MKGVICAGGNATRLYELSRITNKHLLPVGPWPMIYYPLQMLQLIGVTEVMVVTGQSHAGDIINLLGDGHLKERGGDKQLLDMEITYRVQTEAGGIAQAVGMAHSFIGEDDKFVVVLGDNIIEGNIQAAADEFAKAPAGEAMNMLKEVADSETSRFGIAKFNEAGRIIEIVEKPGNLAPGPAPSNFAQVGIYFYDHSVFDVIANLKPSSRGELEIADVNDHYAKRGKLLHTVLEGWWRDVGSIESLSSVGQLIAETGANNV
jgi:glucose-1-phosphate thymidylyltransferase